MPRLDELGVGLFPKRPNLASRDFREQTGNRRCFRLSRGRLLATLFKTSQRFECPVSSSAMACSGSLWDTPELHWCPLPPWTRLLVSPTRPEREFQPFCLPPSCFTAILIAALSVSSSRRLSGLLRPRASETDSSDRCWQSLLESRLPDPGGFQSDQVTRLSESHLSPGDPDPHNLRTISGGAFLETKQFFPAYL
jgi:hypothetical protein